MASSSSQAKNLRGGQDGTAARVRRAAPERSASFHHGTTAALEHRHMRRPRTQPELLKLRGGGRGGAAAAAAASPSHSRRRVPAKVLVNVAVQRSLGPVQVVASTDWTVGELAAAALGRYVREGRRPLLPAAGDPSTFELHYSQFSLECLDPKEKLINLGSRNFFLCLKPDLVSETMESSSPATGSCSKQAEEATKISWFSFIDCLL